MEKSGKLLSQRIKALRERLKLTQDELAEKAKIPFPSYRGIEYGKTLEPGISSVAGIARALNVSIDYLYYGETKDSKRADLHVLIDRLTDSQVETITGIIEGLILRNQSKNRGIG